MKDQYADYETANMMKELGFKEPCSASYEYALTSKKDKQDGYSGPFGWKKGECNFSAGYFVNNTEEGKNWNVVAAPLWQQVKEWLWKNHHAYIRVVDNGDETFDCWNEFLRDGITRCKSLDFNSPIEAETEGIKQAVKYLHSKLK